jgi:hypothetical protein
MNAEFPPPDPRLAGKVKVVQLSAQRDVLRVAPQIGSTATVALVSRCAAEIPPEKIQWLWPGRLARKAYLHRW